MKKVIALVAALFAVSAFAVDAPKATTPAPAAPAKVEVKKDAKPAKSEAPAVKDTKATAPVTK